MDPPHVARLAGSAAGRVAAVAVDAIPALALRGGRAGRPVGRQTGASSTAMSQSLSSPSQISVMGGVSCTHQARRRRRSATRTRTRPDGPGRTGRRPPGCPRPRRCCNVVEPVAQPGAPGLMDGSEVVAIGVVRGVPRRQPGPCTTFGHGRPRVAMYPSMSLSVKLISCPRATRTRRQVPDGVRAAAAELGIAVGAPGPRLADRGEQPAAWSRRPRRWPERRSSSTSRRGWFGW